MINIHKLCDYYKETFYYIKKIIKNNQKMRNSKNQLILIEAALKSGNKNVTLKQYIKFA